MKRAALFVLLVCAVFGCTNTLKRGKDINYNTYWNKTTAQIINEMNSQSKWRLIGSEVTLTDRLSYISPKNDSIRTFWIENDHIWSISMSYPQTSELYEPQGIKSGGEEDTWYDLYNNVKTVRRQAAGKSIDDTFTPISTNE